MANASSSASADVAQPSQAEGSARTSPALTLFLAPGSSSLAAHIALHEVGVPFETRILSLARKDTHARDFLEINPAGKVPALLIDGRPLTEVAGILFYLARRFPHADLLPQGDTEAEAEVVSWMSFLASSAHPAWRAGGDEAVAIYEVAERRLAPSGWAVGDRFSIADIHLFRLFRRFHDMVALPRKDFPGLFAHLERVLSRDAVRRTLAAEAAWD